MTKAEVGENPGHRRHQWQLLRFALVGGAAAVVNIASRVVLSKFVSFELAVVVAYVFGMTFAFVMNRKLVFQVSNRPIWNECFRFFLVNVVALVQVWLVSIGLFNWILPAIGWTFYVELTAHAIAVCSPILTSYYAHKFFTFR
jgi:putative flippase GtrA